MASRSGFFCIAVFCFLCSAPLAAFAQEGASIFESGLSGVAREGRLFIAVEGAPLQANAHQADITAIIDSNSPSQTKVQRIAALFDYRVKPSGNVSLLNKNYTNVEDLPCVTEEEVMAFVRNLTAIGIAYAPLYKDFTKRNDMRSEKIFGIFDSLDKNQRRIALANGVPLVELSDAQKSGFQSWAQSDVAGELPEAADFFQSLRGSPSDARLAIQAGRDGREGVVLLNGTKPERTTALWDDGGRTLPAGSPRPVGSLPAVPRSYLTPPITTLAEAVRRIAKGARFRASAEVADKPVIVAGMENVTPEQALNALARLYDLGVVNRTAEWVIERRTIRPSGFDRLAQDIEAAVPLPLRGLLFRPLRNNVKTPPAPSDCARRASLYAQALRAPVQQSQSGQIRLAALPARARAAVALFLLTVGNGSDLLDSMVTAARRAALFQSEADRLTLRYRQSNEKYLNFEVGYNFSGEGGVYGYHGIGGGGPLYRLPQN